MDFLNNMDFLKKRPDAIGFPWYSTASYEAVSPPSTQPKKKMAGGQGPVRPPQEMQLPAPEEYIPTQKAQPSGGSLSDSIKSGAKSFLRGLAEMGYAGSWSALGNRGSYIPSWDEATVYSNPNSEASANARNLMMSTFGDQIGPDGKVIKKGIGSEFGAGGRLAGSSYREIADTYGPDLYKSQYNDYLNRQLDQQAALRQNDLRTRLDIASMRREQNNRSNNVDQRALERYAKIRTPQENIMGEIDDFLKTSIEPDGSIKGLYSFPFVGTFNNPFSTAGTQSLAKLEAFKGPLRNLEFGTAQSAQEMKKFERRFAEAAPGSREQVEAVKAYREGLRRNIANTGRGFSPAVVSAYEGPVSPQPSPPSSSGGKRRGILNPATGKIEWNQ